MLTLSENSGIFSAKSGARVGGRAEVDQSGNVDRRTRAREVRAQILLAAVSKLEAEFIHGRSS